jgi:adenosylmethionine-8-amino-7-oxononanoate aminotransferase
MAVSGRSIFTAPFTDLLFDVDFIETPCPGNEEKALGELNGLLAKYEDIAAFIYEPLVQGTAGMVMYAPEILDKILQRVKAKNIIAIADEVMTGFGRTGRLFAGDHLREKADIICVSKGITGGFLPLGVTACTADIYNAFLSQEKTKALFHGHSYTANPLACAAALASMDLLLSDDCMAAIQRITGAHAAFAESIKDHAALSDIRHQGTILAVDIKVPDGGNYLSEIRDRLYAYFIERGILIRPLGNTIYLIPPYCTGSGDLQYVYQSIENLLNQFDHA